MDELTEISVRVRADVNQRKVSLLFQIEDLLERPGLKPRAWVGFGHIPKRYSDKTFVDQDWSTLEVTPNDLLVLSTSSNWRWQMQFVTIGLGTDPMHNNNSYSYRLQKSGWRVGDLLCFRAGRSDMPLEYLEVEKHLVQSKKAFRLAPVPTAQRKFVRGVSHWRENLTEAATPWG